MIRIRARAPGRRALALGLPTVWGAAALACKLTCPLARQDRPGARIVSGAVLFAVGTGLVLHARRVLVREPRRTREVAAAAQGALPRPLPPRVGGLRVAAAQLSADRGAGVGGDLYEVIATEHGVRAVMGDVRGHGIGAVGTVAAVLGSFREAVHDEPDLGRVLRLVPWPRPAPARTGPDGRRGTARSPRSSSPSCCWRSAAGARCGRSTAGTRGRTACWTAGSSACPCRRLGPFRLPPELPDVRCRTLSSR
ncbi:hypothetical protein SGLAM104S_03126 [Streptomyces glaucescens]